MMNKIFLGVTKYADVVFATFEETTQGNEENGCGRIKVDLMRFKPFVLTPDTLMYQRNRRLRSYDFEEKNGIGELMEHYNTDRYKAIDLYLRDKELWDLDKLYGNAMYDKRFTGEDVRCRFEPNSFVIFRKSTCDSRVPTNEMENEYISDNDKKLIELIHNYYDGNEIPKIWIDELSKFIENHKITVEDKDVEDYMKERLHAIL